MNDTDNAPKGATPSRQAQPQTFDEAAVAAWVRRRDDKKLQIADECLDAIRLRGMDPAELGITRTRIRSALFALTEADLDVIIERTKPDEGPS